MFTLVRPMRPTAELVTVLHSSFCRKRGFCRLETEDVFELFARLTVELAEASDKVPFPFK